MPPSKTASPRTSSKPSPRISSKAKDVSPRPKEITLATRLASTVESFNDKMKGFVHTLCEQNAKRVYATALKETDAKTFCQHDTYYFVALGLSIVLYATLTSLALSIARGSLKTVPAIKAYIISCLQSGVLIVLGLSGCYVGGGMIGMVAPKVTDTRMVVYDPEKAKALRNPCVRLMKSIMKVLQGDLMVHIMSVVKQFLEKGIALNMNALKYASRMAFENWNYFRPVYLAHLLRTKLTPAIRKKFETELTPDTSRTYSQKIVRQLKVHL